MILINKQDSSSDIYLTIGDVTEPVTMKVIYPFDGTSYNISLGSDTSLYPSRYNKYSLDSSIFSPFMAGLYIYEVYATDLKETGYLRITGATDSIVELDNTDNQYIVYNED